MASEVPATNNVHVSRMAVAWYIVAAANYTGRMPQPSAADLRERLTAAYIETYNAILANEVAQDKALNM